MNMHKMAVSAVMGLMALVSASNVNAADVIIESQQSAGQVAPFIPVETVIAQSFQQGASNISGAAVYLDPTYFPSNSLEINISLWSSLPSSDPDMSALASGSATLDEGNWFKATWNPWNVASSATTYYLVVTSNEEVGLSAGNFLLPGEPDLYGKGQLYFSSALRNPYVTLDDNDGGYDLVFRTYAYESTAPIPEPETYAMMLAGLGLLALARRRKQKAA